MEFSKTHFHSRVHKIPALHFVDQRPSSHLGLIVFQAFFSRHDLKHRLKRLFEHIQCGSVMGIHTVALILIIQITLGFHRPREMDRYKEDPIVQRVLDLR